MDRFRAICTLHGSRPALVDRSGTLSYAQLWDRVERIAARLDALSGSDARPVALMMTHTAAFPIAMLAALASGRGYVPLDRAFPATRNRQILERADACLLLADAASEADALALAVPGLAVHTLELLTEGPGASRASKAGRGTDLAYVIFTSGTTGTPKGVFQNQTGLLHDVLQYSNAVHVAPTDRLTLLYSPSVNGAIRDIFGALLNGAALHVLDPRALGPDGIAQALRAQRITIYHSVPVVFRRVMAVLEPAERLPDLRLAYLAGDRVDPSDVALFRAHSGSNAFFYTGIGASEVATLYAHMFLSADDPVPGPRLPVGHAILDRPVSLFDPRGIAVAEGETGQIAVTSRFLARGYWGDPVASAQAFQVCPDGTQRYLTGDLGRWRPDGLLEHLGRSDHQVKIRGHRVELADVESALSALPGVGEAAALVRQATDGAPVLVALWAPSADGIATGETALRTALQNRMAPWAVPGRFVRLQALPRLANHKPDRQALAALADDPEPRREVAAAKSDLLAQVLETVRGVSGMVIGPDDWFDACGIDSLHAVQILSALERGCGRSLLPALVGPDSTARWIAHQLRDGARHEQARAPVLLKACRDPRQSPLLVMADVEGDFRHVGRLVRALPDARACLGFAEADRDVPDAPEHRLAAIASRAAAAIVAAGLQPPYALLGYSFGGRLAYAVAVQLRALGHAVGFLGLIDTTMRTIGFHPRPPDETNSFIRPPPAARAAPRPAHPPAPPHGRRTGRCAGARSLRGPWAAGSPPPAGLCASRARDKARARPASPTTTETMALWAGGRSRAAVSRRARASGRRLRSGSASRMSSAARAAAADAGGNPVV